jgi:hypothetical protein
MDTKDDESSPGLSPHRQAMDHLLSADRQGGPCGHCAAPNSSARRSGADLVRSLTSASERREARLHELREQVQNGTYQMSAEHIAEKMLLDALREHLA